MGTAIWIVTRLDQQSTRCNTTGSSQNATWLASGFTALAEAGHRSFDYLRVHESV
jgi:hypothetical protein